MKNGFGIWDSGFGEENFELIPDGSGYLPLSFFLPESQIQNPESPS